MENDRKSNKQKNKTLGIFKSNLINKSKNEEAK